MRQLTGEWYLKKGLFGYQIMVEVNRADTCEFDFSRGPEYKTFEKATDSDIVELGIQIV